MLSVRSNKQATRIRAFGHTVWRYRWEYGMTSLGLAFVIIFAYMPMIGLQIAFKDYQIGSTIWSSPWVGLQNFSFLFNSEFWNVVKNTIFITVLRFIIGFPAPIILALMLNEVRIAWFKKVIQTVSYIPHFISWIVVAYILEIFLSPSVGIINELITTLGMKSVYFLGKPDWFRPIVVISGVWKEVGWGTIIYLAAISSLDPQLYDAAHMDGAGRWKQMLHITLPGISPAITILLILGIPSLLNAGMEQILPLMNPANLPVSDVLDTFVLRNGLLQGHFSMATAVGLLSSVLSLLLVLATNKIARRLSGQGLW